LIVLTSDQQNAVFCLALLGCALAVSIYALKAGRPLLWWLRAEAIIVLGAICFLTYRVFEPILFGSAPTPTEKKVVLPAYDYSPWHAWPVQVDGRVKPFITAATEAVRQITGRAKFEGEDPVAVALQWMLLADNRTASPFVDWENYPFIRCDHRELRERIYGPRIARGEVSPEVLEGKYVAPADLRDSPAFKEVIRQAEEIRAADREKASQLMEPIQRKAEEVAGRLAEFDALSQYETSVMGRPRRYDDPVKVVALDRVPSGGWFSLGELRKFKQNADEWTQVMGERMSRVPQLYFSKEKQEALARFQQQIKTGQGQKTVDDLAGLLAERRDKKVKDFEQARASGDVNRALKILVDIARTPEERKRVMELIPGHGKEKKDGADAAVMETLRTIQAQHDDKVLQDLKERIQAAVRAGYRPDNPEYAMLHINYLENRFPDLYKDSMEWQQFPTEDADRVLAAFDRVGEAYRSGDAGKFATASEEFFQTVRQGSEQVGAYPGEDTVGARLLGLFHGRPIANASPELLQLEMQFDRIQPFQWAWIIMLGGVVTLIASLALASSLWYRVGLGAYLVALAFQGFGFYARVALSGRPPVSNMYETVIWVSFMTGVFALILEFFYPKRIIALAGALVSTLGLVLADQLPLALDPKISPIVPVLRSNYWLTIHVLTIVSSYAGGALAWGLGNLALGLLAFGQPRRELLKTLSQFTYKAMQIAVLLLAAGTFLGGWWAVDSWGRFWGWDPKEVWALIALVCYVIPLHMRYVGWVKDFGLAVSAVLCFSAIVMSWYGVNFVLGAGLHSYGFGGGGPWWVFWAGLLNVEWVLVASMIYWKKLQAPASVSQPVEEAVLPA
jgi:ABC-type transport system involved in cytochrome c biogenesis permease subunit